MEISGQLFDVIVVGAGVMGSATAYQTAKRGLQTLLIEQFNFLHHYGSSHGESRTVRATYTDDFYSAMTLEASRLWEEVEAESGYKVYYRTKHIDMGPANSAVLRSVIDGCRKNSMHAQVLNPDEVSDEFSSVFQLPSDWMGVVTEAGGIIKASESVAMFQSLARQNGATLVDNAEVINIGKDSEMNEIFVTTSSGGKLRAKKCVIAAGPWTRKLIEKVRGIVLPIQPHKVGIYYWKIREGHEDKFSIARGFPTFICHFEPSVQGAPSLEFPGLVKVVVHGGSNCEADDGKVMEEAPEEVRQWIKKCLGEIVEVERPVIAESCMYSMTPDGDYVIDFLGGEFGKDAVVCGGFSGHGFKMATVVGRMVAEMVVKAKADGVEYARFRAGRFEGNENEM